MGMIQTILRKVPDGVTPSAYMKTLHTQAYNNIEGDYEDYEIFAVKPERFDEIWSTQKTFKDTPEIREKYRGVASEGNLIAVEIDW
jgi:hypothetical protein